MAAIWSLPAKDSDRSNHPLSITFCFLTVLSFFAFKQQQTNINITANMRLLKKRHVLLRQQKTLKKKPKHCRTVDQLKIEVRKKIEYNDVQRNDLKFSRLSNECTIWTYVAGKYTLNHWSNSPIYEIATTKALMLQWNGNFIILKNFGH